MIHELAGNPDFGHLKVQLEPGERILVESGAMAHMTLGLDVKSRLMGGFMRAMMRKMFAGESLLVGEYSGPKGGQITLSPSMPGMVLHRTMNGSNPLYLQGGSFLAGTPGLELTTRFGGLRALFSGEGLFFLHVDGAGELYYTAHGAIIEKEIDGIFVVDTGHVVGWEPGLTWKIRGMGNLFSTFFSGEGLVIEFTGRGKLLLQSRSFGGFTSWLGGYCR